MIQLTLKEAIEQGFRFYGHSDEGYQPMKDICDFNSEIANGTERLFKKYAESPWTVTPSQIKECLVDNVSEEYDQETGDDTSEMYDFLNVIPVEKFDEITRIINEAAANKHYYKLSEIKLVP